MQIVKVSPKGQITIPKEIRDHCQTNTMGIEITGKTITLRPIEIKIVNEQDENKDFGLLSKKSFSFWNDSEEDAWDKFLTNAPSI